MAIVLVKNKASNILFTYSVPPSIDIPDDNDSRGEGGHACFICGECARKLFSLRDNVFDIDGLWE